MHSDSVSFGAQPIFVTGATGFVGSALLRRLVNDGVQVRALHRSERPSAPDGPFILGRATPASVVDWRRIGSLDENLPLEACSVVVHLAARVHVMRETEADALGEFRKINVVATEKLARDAARAGVRRFIYLSSIKVNGEETKMGHAFSADDTPAPEDAYGISKYEAEIALRRVAEETGLEVVVIRPPLVYGPNVKGNFKTMLRWLQRGFPLPLRSVDNRRSLVGVDNLCDLIVTCLTAPRAANEIFLVSDGHDVSTAELLRMTGVAMGYPAHLIPCPIALLHFAATILGRPGITRRLCGNLQVDIRKTKTLLDWYPPFSVEDGLSQIFNARK